MTTKLCAAVVTVVLTSLLTGCEFFTVQTQFKLVERWSSRWCLDSDHEALDSCKTSDGINRIAGAVGALRDGRASTAAPMQLDRAGATKACLQAQPDAISNLNAYLSKGAKVVMAGEKMHHYTARTQPPDGEKHYHLIRCNYRQVILEGPKGLLQRQTP